MLFEAAQEFVSKLDPFNPIYALQEKQFFIPYRIVGQEDDHTFALIGGSFFINKSEKNCYSFELMGKARHYYMRPERLEVVTSCKPYAFVVSNRTYWLSEVLPEGYAATYLSVNKLFIPVDAFKTGQKQVISSKIEGVLDVYPLYLVDNIFVRADDLKVVPEKPSAFILSRGTVAVVFAQNDVLFTYRSNCLLLDVLVAFNQRNLNTHSILTNSAWWKREMKRLAKRHPDKVKV
jgi:hypothetical protein